MVAEISAFIKQSIRSFQTVGSIFPSSAFLGDSMSQPLDELKRGQGPVRVLEVGPGTGSISRRIVKRLDAGDSFDLVEINPAFASRLRSWAGSLNGGSPSTRVHELDVRQYEVGESYDLIVSCLPFNIFPSGMVDEIIGKLFSLSRPGGVICFFEYLGIWRLKGTFADRRRRDEMGQVREVIGKWFGRSGVARRRVYLNIPPAGVFYMVSGEAEEGSPESRPLHGPAGGRGNARRGAKSRSHPGHVRSGL